MGFSHIRFESSYLGDMAHEELDAFIRECMQDPDFANAYLAAQERSEDVECQETEW